MSADRQRLVGAIRRIVKEDPEVREALGGSANRGDQAGSGAKAASQGEEERICCDGSTAPANLGTSERDPDAEGAGQGGLDSNDPARLTSGDGTLSGVTDCATGEPVCFDGGGFIPPEDWDGPSEPPLIEDYDPGVVYKVVWDQCCADTSGQGRCPETTYHQTCSQAKAYLSSQLGSQYTGDCDNTAFCYSIRPNECSGSSNPDVIATCELPPPTADTWPSDGCVNLAIKGGKIVGSKYDPENDGSYSAPRDSIDLCDQSNGAQITLRPSGQSNYKTIDAVNGGDGYLYSGGEQIARVSGDEFTDPAI